jgi:hypothetical protein
MKTCVKDIQLQGTFELRTFLVHGRSDNCSTPTFGLQSLLNTSLQKNTGLHKAIMTFFFIQPVQLTRKLAVFCKIAVVYIRNLVQYSKQIKRELLYIINFRFKSTYTTKEHFGWENADSPYGFSWIFYIIQKPNNKGESNKRKQSRM